MCSRAQRKRRTSYNSVTAKFGASLVLWSRYLFLREAYAAFVAWPAEMPREGAGQLPALLLEKACYLQPTKKPERRTGSAPSKAANDAPIRPPPPVGGDYALLPCGLALLATQRTRRAFCPCGGECGACGSRSECSRSFAGRKLPADASGGGTADR